MIEYTDETAGVIRENGKALKVILKHNGNPVEFHNLSEISWDEGKELLKLEVSKRADMDAKVNPIALLK